MGIGRTSISIALAASLSACGGGGSDPVTGGGGASPPPTSGAAPCSLSARQDWVFSQIKEFHLFPELLDLSVNKANFNTVQGYIDAIVADARERNIDKFGTFITSIEEENAFNRTGSTAGFGIRLVYDTNGNRVFVTEAFEQAPAFPEGFDRGTELLAIGTSASNLESVATIMANEGTRGVIQRLGPSDPGVTRVFDIVDRNGNRSRVTVSKAEYALDPVSDRYGAQILNDGTKQVGYLNLRTFISAADDDLRVAFDRFRAQNINEVILDFRYNGGGLVSTADLLGDLMGEGLEGQIFSRTTFRASKSENNSTQRFRDQPESIRAMKIAVIGREGTASASELVPNSFLPYVGDNLALVGTNTFGKPVGQIGLDREECDDRLRVIAFQKVNANGNGEYYSGLASVVPNTCAAPDDISRQMGDPGEASTRIALDYLAGRSCTPITAQGGGQSTQSLSPRRELLQPDLPNVAQREIPGLF